MTSDTYLILHGPNLNLLGEREPTVYGTLTQDDILHRVAEVSGKDIELFQSNHEGTLIDTLHEARNRYAGVLFNPGAYSHYSYALYDAIRAIDVPVVEVHLSDITAREEFRKISVTAPACIAQYHGMGIEGYEKGIIRLIEEAGE